MSAISLDEYKKRRQAVQQEVARPNTILFSDYQSKYGKQKLPTEVTRAGNSFLLPTIEQPKVQKQEEQYIDTGKTYGDYWYQEYGKRKDDKIYSRGGKYYVLNSRTGEYDDVDRINYMTTEELDKKQLEEAQSLGYKGNKADLAKISNKILLDTGNLTKKEYADYSKDLKRQEEKLNKEQAEKTKIRYSGTGIDALKQIGTKASDVAYTADKEVIAPIKNVKENYNIGKQNNELAIEYYKKMEGKKNNAKELEEKQQKFNRYNQDLITNPGAAGTAIQNMNTQVESLKGQTVASGLLALLGGAVGFGVGGTPGAVAGAKAGASIGYTFGGTPYTYKLEAGNQYKDLIEQGIPKNIAKDLSRKTGAINAAIESGENVLDIITFGRAGKLKNAAEQELYNQLKKEYGEKALKTLLIKTGYSYAQNILSESAEEMAQEGTSIHYEREAYKNAKLDRPVTTEEDINRILEAGKSAAVSTAFTAPVTSFGGSLVTNIVDNLQTQAIQKVNTLTNSQINNEIATAITNVSNENNTNLTTEEILTIQQQVKNDLNGKNITIIDDTNTQTKEQIQNRIASLKEDLQTYETFTNEATRTESETREINNIKQEIKNLQQELKQQNNIPTVQDLVNQERNNQNLKLPTRELTFAEEVKKNNINMNNESVQSIQNMLENRNIKFSFDEKAFDNNSIESLWRESIDNNGNIIREVIFNPNATDSNKYLQNLAIHELYHDISNSQQGQSIKTELLDYVSRIDGYKEARTALESTYSKLYDSTNPNFENMVNDEVVAHILGQKLGNQQFVNSLSYQQPSIARQIYNWVIDKLNSLNKLVGYRSEKIFWSDIKNKFDNAYRTQYNSSQQLTNATMFATKNNFDFNVQEGDLKNNFYDTLSKYEWKQYHSKMNKILNSTYGDFTRLDIINGKLIETVFENGKEQVKNIYQTTSESNYITEFIVEEVNKNGHYNSGEIQNFIEEMLGEGNFTRYNSTDNTNNQFTKQEQNSRNTNENNRYSARTTIEENYSTVNRGELDNSSFSNDIKQQQLDIINKSNPADDEVHTWIRSTDDIKTFEEAFFEDGEYSGMDPDFTEEMANDSLKSGEITVYSSNPIENGTFVSPSQMEASQYAGGDASKLHSKTVNINDVAWIDGAEGQYAKVDNNTNSSVISTKDNQGRTLSKQQQDFFKDSKIKDKDGNLLEVYHGTNNGEFTIFNKDYIGSSNDKGWYGEGFYFATHEGEAKTYGQQVKKAYLNIKNPFNFDLEMQSYDGQTTGDVNYDFGSFMINLDEKFPEIAKKEKISYGVYDKNNNLVTKKMSLSELAKQIKDVYNDPNLKITEYDDAGNTKYGYIYGKDINNSNIPTQIKDLIRENGIYNKTDAQFAKDNPNYYPNMTTNDINKVLDYYKNNDTDFSVYHFNYQTDNIESLKNNRLSEATYYVTNELNKYVDTHIPEVYMQSFGDKITETLKQKGYDGVIQSFDGDEIVAFYPNQIKNVDNLNPTTNNDIRFSKNNKSWDKFVESNFKTEGTGERLQDVLLPTKDTMKYSASTIDDNLRSLEANAPAIETEQIAPVKKITTDPTKESSYDDADLPNFWELNKNKKSNLDNEIDEFKRAVDRQLQEETTTPKQIKRNNTLKSQLSDMYSRFQEQFINRNHEIDKYSKLTGNKEIMYKGDMLNNVAGEVTGDINIGQTDNYGKQIGESLNSLFKNAKKKGYYDQFDDYLKHYSNIDRHGYGKGSVVPLEYSRKMVKAYEKSIPGIKNEATKVWQYGKNMLSNMEENGLISKDFKATLEDMYPHYVPYMQSDSMVPYMDDSGEIKPKKVIKRAEGKAHDLITVEEALEKYTYAHKKAIRQNDLYKEIVKTSKEKISIGGDDRVDPTQLNNSLGHDMEGNGFLTAYVDGNMQQAQISDALYQELAKINELRLKGAESKYAPILKPLQKISEIRRNILTTWNPSFLLTNSIKDIQDGLLNSKYTKDMVKNYPGAFYELATQSTDTARQFSSLYGSGMVMGEYQVDRLTNSTKNLDIKQLNKIMQTIPNLNEIIELTPRYAEFKASLEHGTSVTEAMYNARELTTNFGRGGYITKALNRNGFTFLNASVQGFDKMIRNFTGANGSKGIAVSVTGTLMKVVALGVAPALFNATAFGAGDDDEDEAYKALPNYIKDNYYLFKVKGLGNKTSKYYDGTFLRIPKGRVLSVFGSAARRTLEFTKGDKNAFDGYLKNVDSQIGINNPEENNIFAPIKQAFGSKNGEAWYGGDIIPKRLQNKPAAEQYDESTDEFSKWLGKTLNISPYKINYLVDQYSGGVGDIVLPMITKETTNGATTVPDYLLAPLKDKFIVNSTDDNKYASNFYSSLEKAQTKANGEKAKVEDKLKYKYMSSISSDMSKLYKEKREIQLDDSLTKKQKYKKVQNVQKEINRLAEEGIKDYKVKDLKSNYGKIANKEYYKNNKNEWSVIKDEESADLNSMRMTSNEKNNYFIAKNKISNIKQQDIDSKIKKSKISDIVLKTNLSDEKMAYLYGKYYSKEETLDIIQDAGISIKEFIKFDSQDIESDYYANGKAVPNSKKKKTIAYINSLNLSAIQKAMLIRMEYSSFTSYDRQIIQYVNNQKLNSEDKKAIYEKLGFKIRNGRVYSK